MLKELYSYNSYQWGFFFMLYCFAGWIWETFYVSLFVNKPPKYVNRGFMKGPFLPIYGSGAITILVLTIPIKSYPFAVFILGILGPTLLELVTGILMEYLFKVRYWDYTHEFCNFRGYICLKSSIFWGVISLAVTYGVHPEVEKYVLTIPQKVIHPLVTILGILMIIDFTSSFHTALEFRSVLESLEKYKDEFIRSIAEVDDRRHRAIVKLLERNPGAVSKNYAESLNKYRDLFINNVSKKIEAGVKKIQEEKEEAIEKLEKIKDESAETLEKYRKESAEAFEKIKEEGSEAIEKIREEGSEAFEKIKEKAPKHSKNKKEE